VVPASRKIFARVLDGGASAKEVEDDGDDGKDQQDVNEKCCDVEDQETCEPGENQHYCYYEKHLNPSLSGAFKAKKGIDIPGSSRRFVKSDGKRMERFACGHKAGSDCCVGSGIVQRVYAALASTLTFRAT
jgi:hypothetical protein